MEDRENDEREVWKSKSVSLTDIYIYTGLVIIDDNSLLHPGKRAAQSFGETLLAKLSPFPLLREEREREIEFGFDIGDN